MKAYEDKYINKINSILKTNYEKEYLSGFYYFINNHLSYSSSYDYINHVLNFMNYTNKVPELLTLDNYTEYLSNLRDKTSSYQITVYSALKKFSEYLLASQRNTSNPMQYIKRPKFVETQSTKIKRENGVLKKDEISIYLKTVEYGAGTARSAARQENWKERDKLMILIFLSTGMRCSALYKLNVDSINIEKKKLITVEKRDKIAEYPLSDDIIKCTEEWLAKRQIILADTDEDALFISNQKVRMDQSSIYRSN